MVIDDRSLIKLQSISGLIFATFLILHLSNMTTALLGQNTYDQYMRLLRWYYQYPLIEIFVVGAASLVHIYASIKRGIQRRKKEKFRDQNNRPSLRLRLHRYSGYFILLAFFCHVIAAAGDGADDQAAPLPPCRMNCDPVQVTTITQMGKAS